MIYLGWYCFGFPSSVIYFFYSGLILLTYIIVVHVVYVFQHFLSLPSFTFLRGIQMVVSIQYTLWGASFFSMLLFINSVVHIFFCFSYTHWIFIVVQLTIFLTSLSGLLNYAPSFFLTVCWMSSIGSTSHTFISHSKLWLVVSSYCLLDVKYWVYIHISF